MDVDHQSQALQMSDLRQQIILQSGPREIYDLVKTDKLFRQQLELPHVLEALGQKFGWYLKTYNDFIEACCSSVSTPEIHQYLSYDRAMRTALMSGDLVTADRLFEFLRFHNGLISLSGSTIAGDRSFITRIRRFAILSRNPEVIRWLNRKLDPYPRIFSSSEVVKAYLEAGDLKGFDRETKNHASSGPRYAWSELLKSAYQSGDPKVVNYVVDVVINSRVYMDNLHISMWNELLRSAITFDNPQMEDHVRGLAMESGKKLHQTKLTQMIVAEILEIKDLTRIGQIILEDIVDRDEGFLDVIMADLFNDYHSNNLKIFKIILTWFPEPSFKHRDAMFNSLVSSEALNLLSYLADFLELTALQIDEIYRRISDSENMLPGSPGILRWFRRRGSDKDLYQIDLVKMCAAGEGRSLNDAILSYRVDLSRNGAECLVEAVKSQRREIIRILLNDYRIGCLNFTREEAKLIKEYGRKTNFLDLYEDPQFIETPSPLLKIHSMKNLSYLKRLQLMEADPKLQTKAQTFKKYYLMSDQELAQMMNEKQVPYIPCFHHLACAIFLSQKDPPSPLTPNRLIEVYDLIDILPLGIYRYVQATLYYMIEHGTIDLIGQ